MIRLCDLKLPIDYTEQTLLKKCAKELKIDIKNIVSFEIIKKSIDARRKKELCYVITIGLNLKNNLENKFKNLKFEIDKSLFSYTQKKLSTRPVVVGFGPSGMFSALMLARMGFKPIVLEQGKCVEEREKDVETFWKERKLNKHSNVQFGEGGAGTFSDGKLNTNLNNEYCKKLLWEFRHFGAPEEIVFTAKPHIGSDKLKTVVKNLRNEIISLGGEILFSTKFIDFETENNRIKNITILNVETNEKTTLKTEHLLLCVGHSARDVFKLLYEKGIKISQKPFAMGVRIEQKQHDINLSQYGQDAEEILPPADYKLVTHLKNGRSVFTFCMCPGGEVVASSSEEGEIVTNGMSNFKRDKENANSALLVNVTPEDYNSTHPLAGIEFQAKYERQAFILGGENYNAPAESVGEFLGKKNLKTTINPTYRPGLTFTEISKCLPQFVTLSLKEVIPLLNEKLENFAKDENLLIAIESRSSCPLRIERDENFETNIKGIYPIGEGAGFAGGIISSAQDGIKVAEKIYETI